MFDLEIDAARRAESGSSTQQRRVGPDAVRDVWERKEQYLRRLLVSVSVTHVSCTRALWWVSLTLDEQRPEVLLTLILHLIEVRDYQRALDDLEL